MGKKQKTEVGDEDGEGVQKNPERICPYFFGILELLPQLAPHTRTSRLLKMICNSKRSSDKQSESVTVRLNKRMASTWKDTEDPRTCPGPDVRSIT